MAGFLKPALEQILLQKFFESDLNGKYLVALILCSKNKIERERQRLEKKYFGEKLEILNAIVQQSDDLTQFIKVRTKDGQIERIYLIDILRDLKEFELFLVSEVVNASKFTL